MGLEWGETVEVGGTRPFARQSSSKFIAAFPRALRGRERSKLMKSWTWSPQPPRKWKRKK